MNGCAVDEVGGTLLARAGIRCVISVIQEWHPMHRDIAVEARFRQMWRPIVRDELSTCGRSTVALVGVR